MWGVLASAAFNLVSSSLADDDGGGAQGVRRAAMKMGDVTVSPIAPLTQSETAAEVAPTPFGVDFEGRGEATRFLADLYNSRREMKNRKLRNPNAAFTKSTWA